MMKYHFLRSRNGLPVASVIVFGHLMLTAFGAGPDVSPITTWNYDDPNGPNIRWYAAYGHRAGPMTLACGQLIFGTTEQYDSRKSRLPYGGRVVSYDAKSGKRLWHTNHPRLTKGGYDHPLGIRSKPTVDKNRVYYVSNRAELMCVDLDGFHDQENDGPFRGEESTGDEDADIVWKLDMVSELGVVKMDAFGEGNPICSPLVIDEIVYCVTGLGCQFMVGGRFGKEFVPAASAPSFLAVHKDTGKVVWSSSLPGKDIMYSWSSPVRARVAGTTQVIFPGGDGRLYAFEPKSGKLLWKFDCNERKATRWSMARRGTRNFFLATPVVHQGNLFVGLNHDTEGWPEDAPIWSIDLAKASQQDEHAVNWTFDDPEFEWTYGSVAVNGNIAFTYSEGAGELFAIDIPTGKKLWQATLFDSAAPFSSPVVHSGKLFVSQAQEIFVYNAGPKKHLIGKYQFSITTGNRVAMIQGAPIVDGDTIYFTTRSHLIAARRSE